MSKFLTEKSRQEIKASLSETRSLLFKVESTMHLDSDDNILYHLNDEIKVRLDIVIDYMKGAQMYKLFEDKKGKLLPSDINK